MLSRFSCEHFVGDGVAVPRMAATMATVMPVLPEVDATVSPGFRRPSRSAQSMMCCAMRSLIDPRGLVPARRGPTPFVFGVGSGPAGVLPMIAAAPGFCLWRSPANFDAMGPMTRGRERCLVGWERWSTDAKTRSTSFRPDGLQFHVLIGHRAVADFSPRRSNVASWSTISSTVKRENFGGLFALSPGLSRFPTPRQHARGH